MIDTGKYDLLQKEVKRLREDNHDLRMADWEYERVWEWLSENADNTCRRLLLLIEEWKEEDGLVTIGGRTYYKDDIMEGDECIQEYVEDKPTIACGCVGCWPESQNLTEGERS